MTAPVDAQPSTPSSRSHAVSAGPTRPKREGRRLSGFRQLRVRFSLLEWLVAALCFAASVTPSLYPRPLLSQGVLSGIAVALGLGVGRVIGALRPLVRPDRLPLAAQSVARVVLVLLTVAVASWGLLLNYWWQVDVRRLMAIDGSAGLYVAAIVPVAAATAYVVALAARVVRACLRRYVRLVGRVIPRRGRGVAHMVVASLLVVFVVDVVVAGELVAAINDRLVTADASSDADVMRPRSGYRSGSPTSLVAWDTLGRMGRRFVATGPTADQLTAFNGTPGRSPIRVYVGVRSAASVAERAELAVAELERTGAFERDVLAFITPTGTGSVNHHAVPPLEYMYNGDTAAVAVQYSYLPSWAVIGGDQERAEITARAVFDAVVERLRQQPASTRPLLLLYGESLGSFGSEQIFTDLADIRARTDGVLWVGPTRANRLWRHFTATRDEGSAVWRPVYQGGETVRFGSDGADLSHPGDGWSTPRVVYLQHPSDPVTWWTPDLLFDRPLWMRDLRPPDISTRMPYVPIVTFVQTTIDTILGANAPLGHGHIYGAEQAEAWALIAPPSGWSPADTARLAATLNE